MRHSDWLSHVIINDFIGSEILIWGGRGRDKLMLRKQYPLLDPFLIKRGFVRG